MSTKRSVIFLVSGVIGGLLLLPMGVFAETKSSGATITVVNGTITATGKTNNTTYTYTVTPTYTRGKPTVWTISETIKNTATLRAAVASETIKDMVTLKAAVVQAVKDAVQKANTQMVALSNALNTPELQVMFAVSDTAAQQAETEKAAVTQTALAQVATAQAEVGETTATQAAASIAATEADAALKAKVDALKAQVATICSSSNQLKFPALGGNNGSCASMAYPKMVPDVYDPNAISYETTKLIQAEVGGRYWIEEAEGLITYVKSLGADGPLATEAELAAAKARSDQAAANQAAADKAVTDETAAAQADSAKIANSTTLSFVGLDEKFQHITLTPDMLTQSGVVLPEGVTLHQITEKMQILLDSIMAQGLMPAFYANLDEGQTMEQLISSADFIDPIIEDIQKGVDMPITRRALSFTLPSYPNVDEPVIYTRIFTAVGFGGKFLIHLMGSNIQDALNIFASKGISGSAAGDYKTGLAVIDHAGSLTSYKADVLDALLSPREKANLKIRALYLGVEKTDLTLDFRGYLDAIVNKTIDTMNANNTTSFQPMLAATTPPNIGAAVKTAETVLIKDYSAKGMATSTATQKAQMALPQLRAQATTDLATQTAQKQQEAIKQVSQTSISLRAAQEKAHLDFLASVAENNQRVQPGFKPVGLTYFDIMQGKPVDFADLPNEPAFSDIFNNGPNADLRSMITAGKYLKVLKGAKGKS